MDTDILTPKDLFQKDVCYIIPQFQRPYVWDEERQWRPLWEDVSHVAENYLEKLEVLGSNETLAKEQTNPHFLGAVVLKQVHTKARAIEQRKVIDGQQRLTTLQLLLNAIQQTCKELDRQKDANHLARLVTNHKESIGDDKRHIFKLSPTMRDSDAFMHVMDNGLTANEFQESLIFKAHEYFQIQIKDWLKKGAVPIELRIDALVETAMIMLQMVVIDLNPQDDSNLIFETLNARGTPLGQSELIKNFVLSREQGRQSDNSDIWGKLDDEWWREKVGQGRQLRPRLDTLLNYWLAMRTGSEISPAGVFSRFRKYVGDQEVRTLMATVKQDLANYRDFEETLGRTPEEKSFHYHVDVMQARVITPVLLLLLSAKEEARIRAFDALESFLIRRMICRRTTKDYNRLFLDLASRLRESELDKAGMVTTEFLREHKADAREWPSNEAVADALENSPLYRLLTRGRMRLVLEGVERILRSSGKAEQSEVDKNLTIEHLMPVGWKQQEEWSLPQEDIDIVEASYERDKLIHSIGNLTLATQKLNSSMSNDPWECKLDELQEHSVLLLNKGLWSKSSWDEEAIRSRSQWMANLVSERWPGPSSEVWDDTK